MDTTLLFSVRVAVALVLLTPLLVMSPPFPPTYFPFIVGKALYFRTLTEIAFGLWVVLAIRSPAYRRPRSWLILILAGYVLVALMATAFGVSVQRSMWSTYERMQGFVDLAHWFAFTLVVASIFRSRAHWRGFLNVNLGVSIFMGLLGLVQRLGLAPHIKALVFLGPVDRLDITLGNPTYVGAYMLVNLLIAAGFLTHSYLSPAQRPARSAPSSAMERRRRRAGGPADGGGFTPETWWRFFWITALIMDALMLYYSGTRGAAVGLAAGLIAFAVGYGLWGKVRQVRVASAVLAGSLVGVGLVLLLVRDTAAFQKVARPNSLAHKLANTGVNDPSLEGRIDSGLVGLRGFVARPLLGWGPENFTVAYDRHLTADIAAQSVTSFDQAHNKLIEELVTKGLLGFFFYISLWTYMAWVIAKRVKAQSVADQPFTLFIGAALAGYFVQNLFLFDTPGTVPQFYLLLAYGIYLEVADDSGVIRAPQIAEGQRNPAKRLEGRERRGFLDALSEVFGMSATGSAVAGRGLLRSEKAGLAALVAALAIVSTSIYLVNYRALDGSMKMQQTFNRSITWGERLELFQQSIAAFPGLANYPRNFLFISLTNEWNDLEPQELNAALQVADREGSEAQRTEPEEWRVYLPLAAFYQRVGLSSPPYLDLAGALVATSGELAPERIEVVQMGVQQNLLTRNHDAAQELIDDYLKKEPVATVHFRALQNQLDAIRGDDRATSSVGSSD